MVVDSVTRCDGDDDGDDGAGQIGPAVDLTLFLLLLSVIV